MLRKFQNTPLLAAALCLVMSGCGKEEPKSTAKKPPKIKRNKRSKAGASGKSKDKLAKKRGKSAADKNTPDKGATDKAATDKAATDKAATDKAATDKADADKLEGGNGSPKVAGGDKVAEKNGATPEAAKAEDEAAQAEIESEKAAANAAGPPKGHGGVDTPPAAAAALVANAPGAPSAPPPSPAGEAMAPTNQPPAAAETPPPAAGEPKPTTEGVMPKMPLKLAGKPVILDTPIKRPEPPLDVSGYLSAADLERVLGKKHGFRRADLPGVKPSKQYNSLFYASKRNKRFGVSVQVWRDGSLVDSRTRFNTMRNTYTDVVATNKVTEQGFRAHFAGVVSLVFADPRKPVVASVSCAVKICSPDAIIELSRRVAERLR